MIKTKVERFERDGGTLVVSEATVSRELFLKMLVDNGFDLAADATWNVCDNQRVITIKASGLEKNVTPQEDPDAFDEDIESDC